jgi:hypothetical protein
MACLKHDSQMTHMYNIYQHSGIITENIPAICPRKLTISTQNFY